MRSLQARAGGLAASAKRTERAQGGKPGAQPSEGQGTLDTARAGPFKPKSVPAGGSRRRGGGSRGPGGGKKQSALVPEQTDPLKPKSVPSGGSRRRGAGRQGQGGGKKQSAQAGPFKPRSVPASSDRGRASGKELKRLSFSEVALQGGRRLPEARVLPGDGLLPREKLLALGPGSLQDTELLAALLGTGAQGLSALELAQELLDQFGGLRGLIEADREALEALRGIGAAKYTLIAASLELARRYLRTGLQRGEVLTSPDRTRDFLHFQLREQAREVFACLFLDSQNRLIAYEELFFGTIDGASVHPREVARRALELNAVNVVFAHNHPSGIPEPSEADRRITRRLQAALELLNISVLDHMVIGDTDVVSFAERGLLPPP